jgi:hypothetical protein
MPAYDVTVSAEFEPKSYTIAKDTMTNGTVTFVTPALYGSTVNLTAAPENGYRLKAGTLTVYKTDDAGTTITPSGSGNNWTFTMPAYNVTVSAEFEELIGEILTLNNIPLAVTGQVAVVLFPEDDDENPTAVGIGTLTGVPGSGSVTVSLYGYTGDPSDPLDLDDPWTKDAGKYLILIGSGTPPNFDYTCISPSAMTIPIDNTINASGFDVDGPSSPPVGHITGTLTISGFPTSVKRIYISASELYPGDWQSREETWVKDITPAPNTPFDIPLYDGSDEQGTFGGENVYIQVVVRFTDETTWYLYFDNGGPGYGPINHDDDNPIGSLSDAIPSTKLITGLLTSVTIPSGQLDHVRVGLHSPIAGTVPGADLNMDDGFFPWNWKIRVESIANVGMWQVRAASEGGSEYSKVVGYWTGQSSGNDLGSINFGPGDAGNNLPSFAIDPVYRGSYMGPNDPAGITQLTVNENQMMWYGSPNGSLIYVFTVPGGNITGGTWAYVYQSNNKVGFIVNTTSGGKNIYLGTKATAGAASGHGISTIALNGISTSNNIHADAAP